MINSALYKREIKNCVLNNKPLFVRFSKKKILVTGFCGLIGSYITDLLCEANELFGLNCDIYGIDRNKELALCRFNTFTNGYYFDITNGINIPDLPFDYIIHTASNTSPLDYGTRPIDTISTIVLGTKHILDYCIKTKSSKLLFCSSVEVYGAPIKEDDIFDENYSGTLLISSTRSGYPTGKRSAETMLNAYADEFDFFSFVTARIGRIYGPTKICGDTKVVSQLIDNILANEDLILKSNGSQLYSFGYVGNCAVALLYLLVNGKNRDVYNVGDYDSTMTLKDFAYNLAKAGRKKVRFEIQNDIEKKSYSKVTRAVLDLSKIKKLGWRQEFSFNEGIYSTISALREEKNNGEKI